MQFDPDGADFPREVRALLASKLTEAEKLARIFGGILGVIVERAGRDVELAAALGDPEEKIRAQIRLETTKSARRVFRDCYRQVTGKEAWDEPERR